jgi:membrane-associated phospholipid phosphatase
MERTHSGKALFDRIWIPLVLVIALDRFFDNPDLYKHSPFSLGYFITGPVYQSLIVVAIGVLLSSFARKAKPGMLWWALDVSLGTFLIAQIGKALFRLPRPTGSSHGFPSGHTMFVVCIAWLLCEINPRLAPLWFGFAALVGWSRVATHAHYPYQVFFGAIFGLILSYFVTRREQGMLFQRFFRRKTATA